MLKKQEKMGENRNWTPCQWLQLTSTDLRKYQVIIKLSYSKKISSWRARKYNFPVETLRMRAKHPLSSRQKITSTFHENLYGFLRLFGFNVHMLKYFSLTHLAYILLVDANQSMSVKKSIAISKITTVNVNMPQSQDLPAFLETSIPSGSSFNFAKHRRLNLKIVTRGKIVLKSGVFCQYWLGVLSPALSQTSLGQRGKRERLGTRLIQGEN